MYPGADETVTLFTFPTDNDEYDKWIRVLSNTIVYAAKCIETLKPSG